MQNLRKITAFVLLVTLTLGNFNYLAFFLESKPEIADFLNPTAKAASVSIDCSVGSPRNISLGSDFSNGDSLTLTGNGTCVMTTSATLSSFTIGNGTSSTVLTHAAENSSGLNILVNGNMTVSANASIDVNGKGCTSDRGPNASTGTCGTESGRGSSSNYSGGGGSHGAAGAASSDATAAGSTYGSNTNPRFLGSGGGKASVSNSQGGAGGGLVILSVDNTLTVSGSIVANGATGIAEPSTYASGGGSGGSVNLTVGSLLGSGTISANGGGATTVATRFGGAGGGGRVAIIYGTASGTAFTGAASTGGTGANATYNGSNSTVYTLQFDVANTPSILSPTTGTYNNSVNPTLTSDYSSTYGGHISTDWKVTTDSGGSTVFWSATNSSNLESIVVNSTNGTFDSGATALASLTTYYAFVRHKNGRGDSSWSSALTFTTLHTGGITSATWNFNDATPADVYTFDNTKIEINASSNGLARLKDLGGGTYSGLGVDGTTKRQLITVTNAGASLTNYQLRLAVTYDADMQADFDDLRFTSSDGATEIDYWLESKTDSTSAVVWVEIPTIPASVGTTIYMYYGNASLSSESNMSNVFIFADDFAGPSLNGQWTEVTEGGASAGTFASNRWTKTCSGECKWDSTTNLDAGAYITDPGGKWEAVTYLTSASLPADQKMMGLMLRNSVTSGLMWGPAANWGNSNSFHTIYTTLNGTICNGSTKNTGTYLKIANTTGNGTGANDTYTFTASTNGTSWTSCVPGTTSYNMDQVGLFLWDSDAPSTSATFESFFIKAYAATEPGSSFGSEEALSQYNDIKILPAVGGTHPGYTKLAGFTQTLGGASTGSVKYQISNNGTSWYYHNGTTWTAVSDDSNHNNTAAQINSYLPAFVTAIGTGSFYFKAFLVSNGTQPVEIDTITLTYDGGNPTVPGSFAVSSTSASTVTLGWTASTEDAFSHYEFWYGTNQTDVTNQNGTALEWDNDNAADLSTISTLATTITGLTPGATYYVKGVAVDAFGQTASTSVISFNTNQTSAISGISVSQTTDGSGMVNYSFIADDADDDNTVQVLVEYNSSGTWTKASLGATVTATYGSPIVSNGANYQIGGAGGYITTSQGANGISGTWNAPLDSAASDVSNAQLRFTAYDGVADSSVFASSNFILDLVAPTSFSSFNASQSTYDTLDFTWSAVSDTNFNHYEIWYGTNQSDVQNRQGTALEWDNDNAANLTSAATTSTSITGLTGNTTYYFKIFAVDNYGNESSMEGTSLSTTARPQINSVDSVTFATDGSGYTTVAVTVSDADSSLIQGKVEISVNGGDTYSTAKLVSVDQSIGEGVTIDENQAYQVRSITAGAGQNNQITFVIDTIGTGFSDLLTSTGLVRVTLTDLTNTSTSSVSSSFTIDNEKPVTALNIGAGTYANTQNVTITAYKNSGLVSGDTAASIYCTIDGSTPSASNTVCSTTSTATLEIATTRTLKYKAVDAYGNSETTVNSAIYNIRSVPAITISSPVALLRTKDSTITVTGTISDTNTVSYASVNGDTAALTQGQSSYSFARGIPISGSDGIFTITVVAGNNLSDEAVSTLNIIRDTTAPALTVSTSSADTALAAITLLGTKEASANVKIDGIAVVAGNTSTEWSSSVNLAIGNNSFSLTSVDVAGNESSPLTFTIRRTNYVTAITVTSAQGGNIFVGSDRQFTATGTTQSGGSVDLTSLVNWVSSVQVKGGVTNSGVFQALNTGVLEIYAVYTDFEQITSNAISIYIDSQGGSGGGGGSGVAETNSGVDSASPSPTVSPAASPLTSPSSSPETSVSPSSSASPESSPEVVVSPDPLASPSPENTVLPELLAEAQLNLIEKKEPVLPPLPVKIPEPQVKYEVLPTPVPAVILPPEIAALEPGQPLPEPTPFVEVQVENLIKAPILGSVTEFYADPAQAPEKTEILATVLLGDTIVNELKTATDFRDLDTDGDGLSDALENIYGSNAFDPKSQFATDKKGIAETWKKAYDLPEVKTGFQDTDKDGISDQIEAAYGLNPKNADSDTDGIPDAEELEHNTNPLRPTDLKKEIALAPVTTALRKNSTIGEAQTPVTGRAPAGSRVRIYARPLKGAELRSRKNLFSSALQTADITASEIVGETIATDNNKYLVLPKSLSDGTYEIVTEILISADEAEKLEQLRKETLLEQSRQIVAQGSSQQLDLIVDKNRIFLKSTQPIAPNNARRFVTVYNKNEVVPVKIRAAFASEQEEYLRLADLDGAKSPSANENILLIEFSPFAKGNHRLVLLSGLKSVMGKTVTAYDVGFSFRVGDAGWGESARVTLNSALDAGTVSILSEPVTVTVDSRLAISKPQPIVLDTVNIENPHLSGRLLNITNNKPVLAGKLADNSWVVAHWKSLLLTSAIIADSEDQRFLITPPANLEPGNHTVYLYNKQLDSEGNEIRSGEVRLNFNIPAAEQKFNLSVLIAAGLLMTIAVSFLIWRKFKALPPASTILPPQATV